VNAGQTDPRVQFLSRSKGQILFLTSSEAVIQSGRDIVRMRMVGSNPSARAEGLDLQAVRSNYFQGRDPSTWRTDIANYARVQFREIYPGIDLVYRGGSGALEYDWIVKPGADPGQILLKFEGAESIELDPAGDLVLHTSTGAITHRKPSIFQAAHPIAGHYAILPNSTVRLEIAAYDRKRLLIVDPVLTYSSFLGGSTLDQGNAIAVDSTGAAYVGGLTGSSNFPTLPAHIGPPGEGFITKVSPDGKSLIYSTYISGTSSITGLALDSTGEVFVTGTTSSPTDFPTVNAFQPHQNKAPLFQDSAFVTKLSADGKALLYSTYLGGSQNDEGKAIAVDVAGSAYVAGDTASPDFPTLKPLQSKLAGTLDAFVTKLSPDGTTLVYSTYLGGDSGDKSFGIAVDPGGNAYVTGQTASSNYPTLNAFQPTSLFARVHHQNQSQWNRVRLLHLPGRQRLRVHRRLCDRRRFFRQRLRGRRRQHQYPAAAFVVLSVRRRYRRFRDQTDSHRFATLLRLSGRNFPRQSHGDCGQLPRRTLGGGADELDQLSDHSRRDHETANAVRHAGVCQSSQ